MEILSDKALLSLKTTGSEEVILKWKVIGRAEAFSLKVILFIGFQHVWVFIGLGGIDRT